MPLGSPMYPKLLYQHILNMKSKTVNKYLPISHIHPHCRWRDLHIETGMFKTVYRATRKYIFQKREKKKSTCDTDNMRELWQRKAEQKDYLIDASQTVWRSYEEGNEHNRKR
jgi:hypothetical protein